MLVAVLLDTPTWAETQDQPWHKRDNFLSALVSGALSYNDIKLTKDNVYPIYIEPDAMKARAATGAVLPIQYDHSLIEALVMFDNATHIIISDYALSIIPEDQTFNIPKINPLPTKDVTLVQWLLHLDKQILSTLKDKIIAPPEIHIETITSISQMHDAVQACFTTGTCTFDLETGGLRYWIDNLPITILAFSAQPGLVYVVPLEHPEVEYTSRYINAIMDNFLLILQSPDIDKIAHNVKFDLHWLRRYHDIFTYKGHWYDTMLMAHLLDENRKVGLKSLSQKLFPAFEGYELKYKTEEEWSNAPLDQLVPYAAIDVHLTQMLRIEYEADLLMDDRLYRYFRSMSMPVMWLLEELEYNGMPVDRKYVQESIEWITGNIEKMEFDLRTEPRYIKYEIYRREELKQKERDSIIEKQKKHKVGSAWFDKYNERLEALDRDDYVIEPLNFGSPAQIDGFLYSDKGLGLPDMGTTSRNVLKDFNDSWIDLMMALRQLNKMLGTYYEPVLNMIDKNDRLHGNLNQIGTRTGRLSSSEPNLQNLPVRTPLKNAIALESVKRVKKFFIAPEDKIFIGADMSQAELRTIANVSGDKTMINAYLSGIDLHTLTASRIHGTSYEDFLKLKTEDPEVFTLYRTMAKGANFGLVYGAQKKTYMAYLAMNYGVIITEREELIHRNALFGVYKDLKPWHKNYEAKLQKFGYVRTLFGRKRNLPDIFIEGNDSLSWGLRSKALRNAINSPIQGTSAEYCLLSMVLLRYRTRGILKLINNIHDAVYGYSDKQFIEFVCAVFGDTFVNLPIEKLFDIGKDRSPVPMGIDLAIGSNWSDIKEIPIK